MLGYPQPLGLSQTYIDAQRVVTALERAKSDPSYFDSAIEILNSYVEPERTEVVNKAIALGADPAVIQSLLQSGETIVIEDSGPVFNIGGKRRRISWLAIGASALGIVGAFLAYRKFRSVRS
jgi:hypothetical protein